MWEREVWESEQTALWCLQAYAQHLNRDLESWEIDAILGIRDTEE